MSVTGQHISEDIKVAVEIVLLELKFNERVFLFDQHCRFSNVIFSSEMFFS